MALYFMLLDAKLYREQIVPSLAASWRLRSFTPCQALCTSLLPAAESFASRYHTRSADQLLRRAACGMTFDRHVWTALAGELLWFAAAEIPEIDTASETLTYILAPEVRRPVPGKHHAPIQQAHFGTRDVAFGGKLYRPDDAGLNDLTDVARLAEYLDSIDEARWTVTELEGLPERLSEEDRAEELDFARGIFCDLRDLYRQAVLNRWVVLPECLGSAG